MVFRWNAAPRCTSAGERGSHRRQVNQRHVDGKLVGVTGGEWENRLVRFKRARPADRILDMGFGKKTALALMLAVCSGRAQMQMDMQMSQDADMYLMNQASGTSMNPQSWRMPMMMTMLGSWHTMFMAEAFVVDTQQSGARGGDKLYSANWGMAEFSHPVAGGSFMFQLMLSLDPATVTGRRYPELFQTGETAYGRPLVDAQHPHNFIMGMGLNYAHTLGEHT